MWSEVGEWTFFSLATIVEDEKNVAKVRENLKITQSRQKSYTVLVCRLEVWCSAAFSGRKVVCWFLGLVALQWLRGHGQLG
jgi:hypothetical protein